MEKQESPTVEFKRELIADLKKEVVAANGDRFETTRSLIEDLTFQEAQAAFAKGKLEFGAAQMKTLGIKNNDSSYSNLGLLFSDQCLHKTQVAIFAGTDKSEFKDRREFSGSLLE